VITWSVPLGRAAFAASSHIALGLPTFGNHPPHLPLRTALPVTNLESSPSYIGLVRSWSSVWVWKWVYRQRHWASVIRRGGSVSYTLTIFINLAKDDRMKVLQAVLDTNSGGGRHVPIVNMGFLRHVPGLGPGSRVRHPRPVHHVPHARARAKSSPA
jgi:hypothetical protein